MNTSTDMLGNVLKVGDEIVFHTKKFGGHFDIASIVKIEKDVEQLTTQGWLKCDEIYFKHKRSNGIFYTISKPNVDLIKVIREKEML